MSVARPSLALALASALIAPAGAAAAAEGSDPGWPCIQRKTGALSPAIMWPLPLPEGEPSEEARALGAILALRRVGEEEAAARVEAFAAAGGASADELGAVFLAAFEHIDRDRTRIMAGIERYALGQVALARRIEAGHAEMAELSAAAEPDFDRIDALEEQLDWDERVYRDRERALTYVCETPVLLEKRAYWLAQLLLGHVPQ